MLSTAAPAGKGPATKTRLTAGNLKRDINLLPANENSEKMARRSTVILFAVLGLILFYFIAIFWPSTILGSLRAKAGNAQNQVVSLSGVDKEFTDLSQQQQTLVGMVKSLSQSAKDYIEPADMFQKLSSACPGSMTLTTYSQSAEGLTLDGLAQNDGDVAQFIVNLKTIAAFDRVELATVQDKTDKYSGRTERAFEIKCFLPAVLQSQPPAGLPQPSASAAAQGGTGK